MHKVRGFDKVKNQSQNVVGLVSQFGTLQCEIKDDTGNLAENQYFTSRDNNPLTYQIKCYCYLMAPVNDIN